MKTKRVDYIFFVLGAALLFALSACNVNAITSTVSGPKAPLDVLKGSVTTMQQLKTSHIVVSSKTTTGMDQSTSSVIPGKFTVNIKGEGDAISPDQFSMNVSMDLPSIGTGSSQSLTFAEMLKDKHLYFENQKGQWYVIDMTDGDTTNILGDFRVSNYNGLLKVSQKAKINDHGIEKLNGTSLHHITATFTQDALQDLLNAAGRSNSLASEQNQSVNDFMKLMKLNNGTLDVWIDDATSYVHRMEIKYNITMDMSKLSISTPTPNSSISAVNISADTTVDYSKFNAPVTITPPADAIPTKDIISVFSS